MRYFPKLFWILLFTSVNLNFGQDESSEESADAIDQRFRNILAMKWHQHRYETDFQNADSMPDEVSKLLRELYENQPKFVNSIVDHRHLSEVIFREAEPSWVLLLPEGILANSATHVGALFGKLVQYFDGNSAVLAKFAQVLGPSNDREKDDFLLAIFENEGGTLNLSSSTSVRTLSEVAVASPWWNRSKDLVRHFATSSMEALSVIPSDYVSGLTPEVFKDQDVKREFLRTELKDWNGANWGEVCVWKEALEGEFKILQNVYDAFKESSSYPKIRGLAPFLRCYSPEMIMTWKAGSIKISNNKNPVLRMINHYKELKLNALQVRKLSEDIAWENPSLQKRDILHLLDVGQIKKEDLDSHLLFLKNNKVHWPIVLKVLRLKGLMNADLESETSLEFLRKFGRLFVTRPFEYYSGNYSGNPGIVDLTYVNSVSSPLIRHVHSRALIRLLPQITYSKVDPEAVFGVPSRKLAESQNLSGKLIYKKFGKVKFLTRKMLPSQLSAVFQLLEKSSKPFFSSLENPSDVIKYLHPKAASSSLIQSIPASKLPKPIALKLFEDFWIEVSKTPSVVDGISRKSVLSPSSVKSKVGELIPGLTCSQLSEASPLDIPLLASYYNEYILGLKRQRDDENADVFFVTFPSGLRQCFKDRLLDFLRIKSEIFSDGERSPLDLLTIDEVKSVGGWIFSALSLSEIKSIKDPRIQRSVVESIGKIPVSELMPVSSLESLTELAEWVASTFHPELLDFPSMVEMGSLVLFIPDKVLETHAFTIQSLVTNYLSTPERRLLCLPLEQRRSWAGILIKGFASPLYWSSWEITQIGDLLIGLDDEELASLSPNEFRLALPQLLQDSLLHHKYEDFPSFYKPVSFYEACGSWLNQDSSYEEAFFRLMRRFLGLAQYSVIVAETGGPTILPPENLRTREVLKVELYNFHSALRLKLEDKNAVIGAKRLQLFSWLKTFLEKLNREKDEAITNILGLDFTPNNATEIYMEYKNSNDSVNRKVEAIERILIGTQKILIREIKYLMNYSAISISPQYVEDSFCALVDCVDPRWCDLYGCHFNNNDIDKAHEKNLTLNCDGVITAQQSAVALKVQDLQKWASNDLIDCLDVLGSVDWPQETRREVWSLLKEHVNWTDSDQLINLGNILEVFIEGEDEASIIPFTSETMEAVSLIGRSPANYDAIESLAEKVTEFLSEDDLSFHDIEVRKASLLHLLCGLDNEDSLNLIFGINSDGNSSNNSSDSRIFNRLAILGLFKECENEDARKKIAEEVLGYYEENPGNLRPSDVAGMGLFVSGFSPSTLSELSPECFEAIPPSAVRYLSVDHLSEMSVNQLARMTPEALAMFEESQMPDDFVLDLEQLNQLHKVKHSLPQSLFSPTSPDQEGGDGGIISALASPPILLVLVFLNIKLFF